MRNRFCLLLLFIYLNSCDIFSGNSRRERELFESIQEGMTFEEVEQVLGKPDNIDSRSNGTTYYFYFTKNKSGMRSDLPTVIFDSARVTFSSYD